MCTSKDSTSSRAQHHIFVVFRIEKSTRLPTKGTSISYIQKKHFINYSISSNPWSVPDDEKEDSKRRPSDGRLSNAFCLVARERRPH